MAYIALHFPSYVPFFPLCTWSDRGAREFSAGPLHEEAGLPLGDRDKPSRLVAPLSLSPCLVRLFSLHYQARISAWWRVGGLASRVLGPPLSSTTSHAFCSDFLFTHAFFNMAKGATKGGIRKNKDPNAPKRNQSAFFLWMGENRERIKKPGMSVGDVAKAAGVEWGKLTDKSVSP